MRFTGIEITIYEVDGSLSSQPTYECHTVKRAIEIIEATKQLMSEGRTFTFRTF
jgi:ribosomal protein S10